MKHENRSSGSTWAQDREKDKDRTVTKVTYLAYLGRSPTVASKTKICVVGNLADLIMHTKFQDDIFWGEYDFTRG